jgi:fatty acid desaturase
MTGKLETQTDGNYKFSSYVTSLKEAGCSMMCCCSSDSKNCYEINRMYMGKKSREDIINIMETENQACTMCLRITSFLLHFISYYMILYPIIMIVGMIPFFGAVGATVLVFLAFLFSLITYLIIISASWIFARPFLSIVLFGTMIILVFVSKMYGDSLNHGNNNEGENIAKRIAYRIVDDDSNFLQY